MQKLVMAVGALFLLLSTESGFAQYLPDPRGLYRPWWETPGVPLPRLRPRIDQPKLPSIAAPTGVGEVDLALVLAVDASSSITWNRWHLQRLGYAEAFRADEVIRALTSGPNGKTAVTIVQWSNPDEQAQVLPWTIVQDRENAVVFARDIDNMPRYFQNNTALASALDFSGTLLQSLPFQTLRKVIDISGDGKDNTHGLPWLVRDRIVARGVTINGLPIIADETDIVEYYERNVIGGPGAFLIAAANYESFAVAIRRKLVLEIAHR